MHRQTSGLSPYFGHRTNEHFGSGFGRRHTSNVYGNDQSCQKVYAFNSCGYRGEEYDPHSRRTILVCGCSLTFGIGVNNEETWPWHFKLRYAEREGIRPEDVNLLNLSQGAASNDYIARTLLGQGSLRPDLVLVLFTFPSRIEGYDGEVPYSIGPWMLEETLEESGTQAEGVQGYYLFYSDVFGIVESLRNILLLQYFYRDRGVEYFFSWVGGPLLEQRRFRDHPVVRGLSRLLDRTRLADVSFRGKWITDFAADGSHPGPESHARFAEALFTSYCRRSPNIAPRSGGEVRQAPLTDPSG